MQHKRSFSMASKMFLISVMLFTASLVYAHQDLVVVDGETVVDGVVETMEDSVVNHTPFIATDEWQAILPGRLFRFPHK
jgi:hypothetical protein